MDTVVVGVNTQKESIRESALRGPSDESSGDRGRLFAVILSRQAKECLECEAQLALEIRLSFSLDSQISDHGVAASVTRVTSKLILPDHSCFTAWESNNGAINREGHKDAM
jgi:hypothetical protein